MAQDVRAKAEIIGYGSHSFPRSNSVLQTPRPHLEHVSPLRKSGRRRCPIRPLLYPVLILQTGLRLGVLAPAVPVPLPEVRFAHYLARFPHIVRVREVPAPDAIEAHSLSG